MIYWGPESTFVKREQKPEHCSVSGLMTEFAGIIRTGANLPRTLS